jgi:Lrp/AsnC family transcriptional regulator, leucine-responsive regulatory protein
LPAKPRQIPSSAFTVSPEVLDGINVLLLRELHANPRITMSALGRRVGMSAPAVLARRLGQVSECHRITGEDCFLVKVHAAAVPELEELLDQFLTYGQTASSIVVSTPVPPRPLPLPGKDM